MDRRRLLRPASALFAVACAVVGSLVLTPAGSAQQFSDRDLREEARREGWQRVPEILVAVGAQPGARIADIGAGSGFFAVRLARAVGPDGHVTAVDLNGRVLDVLRKRVSEEGLENVDVVEGDAADTKLPATSLDGILIVNAYHEIERYGQALAHMREALKPGGRLVMVEPLRPQVRAEPRDRQTAQHSLGAPFAVGEVRAAGFEIVGLRDPFTTHSTDNQMWMLVARRGDGPAPAVAMPTNETERPTAARPAETIPADLDTPGTPEELASPELRISQDELKKLMAQDAVVLLDIGSQETYEDGHLPGAIQVTPQSLPARLDALRAEKKAIVTYCT